MKLFSVFSVFSEISGGLYSLKQTLFVSPFEDRQPKKKKPTKPQTKKSTKPKTNQIKPKTHRKMDSHHLLLWKVGKRAGILLAADEKNLLVAFTDLGLFFQGTM